MGSSLMDKRRREAFGISAKPFLDWLSELRNADTAVSRND
jgi:hypothetical protein